MCRMLPPKENCKGEDLLKEALAITVGSDASDGVFTIQPQEP